MAKQHFPTDRDQRQHTGFTLVELTVLVAVLMVLVGIAVPIYQRTVQRAATVTATADLATMAGHLIGEVNGGALLAAGALPGAHADSGLSPSGSPMMLGVAANGTDFCITMLEPDGTPLYWDSLTSAATSDRTGTCPDPALLTPTVTDTAAPPAGQSPTTGSGHGTSTEAEDSHRDGVDNDRDGEDGEDDDHDDRDHDCDGRDHDGLTDIN
jgi:type II secretory pathway pseudopilin PulG